MFTATSSAAIALYRVAPINDFSYAGDLGLAQLIDPTLGRDAHPFANVPGAGTPDPVNV